MCNCFTVEEFKREKRQLWRSVAVAYATDGTQPPNMEIWANTAVKGYDKAFSSDVVKCTCGGINDLQNKG